MSKGKKKSAQTAATVQSANTNQHNQDTTNEKKAQEGKTIQNIALECFDSIDPSIWMAERMLQDFYERFFEYSPEHFSRNSALQRKFTDDFEYMQVQVKAISDILFDIRLKCDFVCGSKDEPLIAAHIRNEDKMRSWLMSN